MKKILFFASAITALLATTSCSNEDNLGNNNPDEGKELISFGSANNFVNSRAGFGASTRIVAQIVSEPRTGADPATAKYTKAVFTADADATQNETTFSNVGYAENYKTKYWDDAHGRYSRLSVYAVAIPSQTTKIVDAVVTPIIADAKLGGSLTSWEATTSMVNTIEWGVSAVQTATELNQEDLTYSNNIQTTGDNGCYIWNGSTYPVGPNNASKHTNLTAGTGSDGRLHFEQTDVKCDATPTDAPGHFDKGQMAFKHSLSRIRVKIQKGSTFTEGAFAFKTGTTIELKNMPISGTFNIKEGTWAASPTTGNITKMAPVTVPVSETGYEQSSTASLSNAIGTYEAQMLPGFQFADADGSNVMEFTIDGCQYFVTNKEMMAALKAGSDVSGDATELTTEQGKRYVFTVTVGKSKIEAITATVLPWINVTAAEQAVDNSHVTFNFLNPSGTNCDKDNIWFYKHEQTLSQIYTDNSYTANPEYGWAFGEPATLSDAAPYSTGWYYKDNMTAYHFRTLNTTAKDALDATGKAFFTITAGSNDYHWGAPMKTTANLKYNTTANKGFVDNIEKGIVSATNTTQLKIQELHMMSQIIINLQNDNTAAEEDKINLTGATVTITKMSKTGSVDMATGYITPAAVAAELVNNSQAMTPRVAGGGVPEHSYILSVVPQELKRGTNPDDYVGITIQTTDHNEYYIIEKLSTILATANDNTGASNQGATSEITRWYPNHSYTYTFTLKKSEIKLTSATVANWINVTAANKDITLED
ncbi:MAG: fimbrillin family protein [Prevotella sp.]|nr:fimbrillin family protein [Candidatus Prevotella equi]